MPDAELWSILCLSLTVSGTALAISSLLGIPLGAWLGLALFRGKKLVAALVHTGMALPPVVVGLLVYLLLSRSGPLAPLGWLFTPSAMIVAQTLLALPWIVGITMTAVESTSPDLIMQVQSLGASHTQTRWTIVREARPGVFLAVAAAFGRSISEVGAVLMVGGNIQGHTRVMTTAIVLETGKGQFAVALVLGAWLFVLAFLINGAIVRLGGRSVP